MVPFVRGLGAGELAGFAAAMRADRPTLLHLHVGGRALAGFARTISSAPIIVHVHAAVAEDGRTVRPPLRLADEVIATSHATATEVAPGATVIYAGVELPDREPMVALRPPVVGSLSRLEPIKGLGNLIDAFAVVAESVPEATLELAGSGSAEGELRRLAVARGLGDRVRFLGWQDPISVLSRWRMLAIPSLAEGFPLAGLDAMAAGVPVVASDVGGLPELIVEGETGYLVPAGEPALLAERITALLADPDEAARLGAAGRARAEEHFSAERMASEVASVYESALARHPARAMRLPLGGARAPSTAMTWPAPIKRVLGPPVRAVLGSIMRQTSLRAGVVLVYHRLAERQGDLDRELAPAVAEEVAERQLEHMKARYRVVPLEELEAAVAGRRRGERFPIAITFDDDSPEHIERAAPLLRRLGLPATFFLAGPTREGEFWWESVNRALRNGRSPAEIAALIPDRSSPPPASVAELGEMVELLQLEQRLRFSERLDLLDPPVPNPTSTADLAARLSAAGFDIGFHTRHHERLPLLDDSRLADAMSDGLDDLATAAGQPIDSIAYPYGACDERVAAHARRAGFRFGFTTEPRAVTPDSDRFQIERCDAHGFGPHLSGCELGSPAEDRRRRDRRAPHTCNLALAPLVHAPSREQAAGKPASRSAAVIGPAWNPTNPSRVEAPQPLVVVLGDEVESGPIAGTQEFGHEHPTGSVVADV